MDLTTRMENTPNKHTPNKPMDNKPVESELSPPTAPNKKLDYSQLLNTIATNLFTILKILIFAFTLLSFIFIFTGMYAQQGVVVLPFEISKNEKISGIAIADQLTAELIRIQKIHNTEYNKITYDAGGVRFQTKVSSEQSLANRGVVIPKVETIEFSMAGIGAIGLGSKSLSLGDLVIAFKGIWPHSKPVTTIRGSLQRYGSTIVLVAVLEGNCVQSWMVRQSVDNNNEKQLHEMIKNLAFMIAYDLPQSNVSARTWEGLKYYTEALDAYHQYKLTGNSDDLFRASNYSLMAISSEKEFEKPFDLLCALELHMLSIGRQNDAIEYYKKTLELDPASVHAWNNKANVLHCLGKYDEAVVAYDEAIRLNPKFAIARNDKGIALYSLGKYDEAIQACDEAIRLDPKLAAAWNNKGVALKKLGKYDEAIWTYEEATRLDPEYTIAWNNKGAALNVLSKYDEAIWAYDEAIRLDPEYTIVWNNKGVALKKLGKYDEAIWAYEEATRLDPEYTIAWNNKGFALNDLGKYDEAIRAYDEATRLDPEYAIAWNNKGCALYNLGKYDEAIRAYDEATRLDSEYAIVWNNKGVALKKLGKYDEAIRAYDEAIRLDPELAAAWNNKGLALGSLGRTSEADAAYAKAQEMEL